MERRKKFYFLDYTDDIKYAKRIYGIIQSIGKLENKSSFLIPVSTIIKRMHWSNEIFNNRKSKMHIDSKLITIDDSLRILKQLFCFKDYKIIGEQYFMEDYTVSEKLNICFEIIDVDFSFDFETSLSNSGFHPVKGQKQVLTDLMIDNFRKKLSINYGEILNGIPKAIPYQEFTNYFIQKIELEWIWKYEIMIGTKSNIVKIPNYSFWSLFDESYMREENVMSNKYVSDRTVAYYGYTSKEVGDRKRNDYYMKYDVAKKWADSETDRGHFISHAIGGDIYTNIFPQKRDINRGISERGKVYREMERFLIKRPNLFCFSRPIYFDFSDRPYLIEYGILKENLELWIEIFENV